MEGEGAHGGLAGVEVVGGGGEEGVAPPPMYWFGGLLAVGWPRSLWWDLDRFVGNANKTNSQTPAGANLEREFWPESVTGLAWARRRERKV